MNLNINAVKTRIFQEVRGLLQFLLVVVVINFFAIQPFHVPSGSMIPTFLVGDFLIVNKFCYGYSEDSFRIGEVNLVPFLQVGSRIFGKNPPKQGDVVVFHNVRDRNLNYIKRIIGLPGDKVELVNGVVHLNDKPVELRPDGEYSLIENDDCVVYKKFTEVLPNGYEHVIIKRLEFGQGRLDNVGPFVVPEGHYFMMGDNRDNSQDSRVMEAVGFVHINRIMGRAEALFFSTSAKWYEIFKWLTSIRFERIFTAVR